MSETMQAVVLEKFGGPEVLDNLCEVPVPNPGPTEVPDAEKHGSTITFLPLKQRQASRLGYAVADPVQQ